jgi:hypothetical protein
MMMVADDASKVLVLDEGKEPKYSDNFKISISEGSFTIEFGRALPPDASDNNKDDVNIKVVSKIVISDERVHKLFMGIGLSMIKYEKEFHKELFPKRPKAAEKETKK